MKIYILGPAYPYRGGLAAFNERLAREFQGLGHELHLWTFTLQYPALLFPGKTQYVEGGQAPSDLQIERRINSVWPLNWWQVGRALAAEEPDIVICPYWLGFLAPAFAGILKALRKSDTRVIALVHNLLPHEPRMGDRFFARHFLRNCHAAMALSKSVGEQIAELGFAELPLRVIPHPVYDHYGQPIEQKEARRRLGLDAEQPCILFFGFIRAYKGLDILLEAMADPRLDFLRLVVAGEYYGNAQAYSEQIESLGIANRLVLHNRFIADEEVHLFFSAADMLVQPYRSATQSGVTQMAYHFAKPSLVTAVGGLPELVEHGQSGYVVEPESSQAIVEALLDFYQKQRAQAMQKRVQELAKNYSWEALAQGFLALAEKNEKKT